MVDGSIGMGETIEFQGSTQEAVPAAGHSPARCASTAPINASCSRPTPSFPGSRRRSARTGTTWTIPSGITLDDPLGDYFETLSVLEGLEVDTGSRHARALAWEAFPRRSRVERQHASSS